jgi:quinol monooxygenase YgiN
MSELQVIARYVIAAGNEDKVLELLPKLAAASRTEPGNLSYDVYRQIDDGRSVVILERYVSRDAFAEHRETPHFKDYALGQIIPLLESRTVELLDI